MACAPTDTNAALLIARGIDDPSFACHALAWVARFAPDDEVDDIARESLAAASSDPFKHVVSAAWPIRALVERQHLDQLDAVLRPLLARSRQIELPAGRSEALLLLLQAVFPAGRTSWQLVADEFLQIFTPTVHWRQAINIRDAALIVAREDLDLARDLGTRLAVEKTRRQLERRLANANFMRPRNFFGR